VRESPSPLEWALAYAGMGYRVVPLEPGAKRPIYDPDLGITRGKDHATGDPDRIREVWEKHPSAGVGILPPEDVLVLDLDGPESAGSLIFSFPELGRAPRAATGGGGEHVWLRLPQGTEGLSSSVRPKRGLALDLRGLGRTFVVAPPSVHPSGRRYAWRVPLVPPDRLPAASQALLRFLVEGGPARRPSGGSGRVEPEKRLAWGGRARAYALAELRGRCEEMASTPPGMRHNELVRHAVALRAWVSSGVLGQEEVETALAEAALRSGLGEKEVLGVLSWARRLSPSLLKRLGGEDLR